MVTLSSFLRMAIVCIWLSSSILPASANNDTSLVIFAASSLTNVLTDLAGVFMQEYEAELILNFAGSSTLAAQIQNGAPADIFASANAAQMQNVIESGFIASETVEVFAENDLVVIVPADNPAQITNPGDLQQEGLLLVLAAETVPIRSYADELLITLADDYGDDFPAAVLDNLVSEETNVRQVVARIALGEADAGIVYRTDITPEIAAQIELVDVPPGTSPIAQYFIAPLQSAQQNTIARAFLDFVLSDAGGAILQKWGFCLPDATELDSNPSIPEATVNADVATLVQTNPTPCHAPS